MEERHRCVGLHACITNFFVSFCFVKLLFIRQGLLLKHICVIFAVCLFCSILPLLPVYLTVEVDGISIKTYNFDRADTSSIVDTFGISLF